MGYKAAAVGNHEFDWGQDTLAACVAQSNFPWLGANIVVACTSDHPDWVTPWTVVDVAGVKLGIIGLGYTEAPGITRKGLTDGLEFQDPVAAVLRYYDDVKAQSDALILLTDIGWEDRSEHKGGQTIATELAEAGKPVDLIIGGHSHEEATAPHTAGDTPVVIAYQYGRWMGRAMEILGQSATLHKSIIKSSGITWSYYNDCSCNEPTVWGAVDVKVDGEPLQLDKAYRVTTNDFLAPGGDEWVTFAEGTNRENTYVDMQEVVNDYIGAHSPIAPAVEGRIIQVEVPAELPATGGIPMSMPIVLTAVGFALAGTGLLVRQKRGQAA